MRRTERGAGGESFCIPPAHHFHFYNAIEAEPEIAPALMAPAAQHSPSKALFVDIEWRDTPPASQVTLRTPMEDQQIGFLLQRLVDPGEPTGRIAWRFGGCKGQSVDGALQRRKQLLALRGQCGLLTLSTNRLDQCSWALAYR